MNHPDPSHMRLAAYLLIGGWVMFWAGAFTPPWEWWYPISAQKYLQLIAEHRGVWLWIAVSFALGVILTASGLIVLASLLRSMGDHLWGNMGQSLFLLGSVLWLASIAFRATATVSAASETVMTGAIPTWFEPMKLWSSAIFAVYMILAYLALAAFGKALLQTSIVPTWISWTHIVFGLAGAIGFLARIPVFDPPLMIHLPPGILGIVLLTHIPEQ